MDKILSIDPSGTGTTGIYYRNGKLEEFKEYKEKNWQNHYRFIQGLVKAYQPNILLFESTNFVGLRGKDMTSLFKLLGTLEVLPIPQIKSVPVDQVKRLTKELLHGIKKVKEISYQPGRGKGWMYKNKRISIHCLEAYLVFYLSKKG